MPCTLCVPSEPLGSTPKLHNPGDASLAKETSVVKKNPCSISVSPCPFAESILEVLSALPPLLHCQNWKALREQVESLEQAVA
jgi:hypothetical protein